MSVFNTSVSGGGAKFTLTVSVTSGAQVTASKGDKVVSGTSTNGEAVLVLPEAGEWTVSGTLNGQASGSVAVEVVGDYTAALTFVDSVLNNNDWSTISEVSDAGTGANYWSVGDRKQVTLNGTVGALSLSNFSTYAFIIGFNHNSSREGTGRIHFQLAKTALSGGRDICFIDRDYNFYTETGFCMNSSNTNSGGWKDSHMRNDICGTSKTPGSENLINALPSELRNILKSVTKYTDNTGGGGSVLNHVTSTNDYIFLPSEYEVSGTITSSNAYEANYQKQYSYYATKDSTKYEYNSNNLAGWWLRSVAMDAPYYFIYEFMGTSLL